MSRQWERFGTMPPDRHLALVSGHKVTDLTGLWVDNSPAFYIPLSQDRAVCVFAALQPFFKMS